MKAGSEEKSSLLRSVRDGQMARAILTRDLGHFALRRIWQFSRHEHRGPLFKVQIRWSYENTINVLRVDVQRKSANCVFFLSAKWILYELDILADSRRANVLVN